jgi:hypothetical protein
VPADDVKSRFVNEIKLRGYDDKYIDRNEEREILQIAIQLGVSVESARVSMAQVCEQEGYVLESAVLNVVLEKIRIADSNDGKVDRKEFDRVFQAAKVAMQGKKTDREIKKLIVTQMEDIGSRVKIGWFRDWYTAMKKELGMA